MCLRFTSLEEKSSVIRGRYELNTLDEWLYSFFYINFQVMSVVKHQMELRQMARVVCVDSAYDFSSLALTILP